MIVKGLIFVAGLALLVTACGPASHVVQSGSAIEYARCMRTHGVANWPDPNAQGVFDKSKLTSLQLGASEARIAAAQEACRGFLPNGGSGPTAAQLQQEKEQGLEFARCVRAHGVPTFPDPGSDGRIPDPAAVGIDQGSPTFQAANRACGKDRPSYIPTNAAYDAYARTH
ncbi:MAG TPA: hypothetical protein VKR23_08815 [Gaiellaceae bacterium]|nr:hypothetical protein [Gaiellaceae bacterium]